MYHAILQSANNSRELLAAGSAQSALGNVLNQNLPLSFYLDKGLVRLTSPQALCRALGWSRPRPHGNRGPDKTPYHEFVGKGISEALDGVT